MLKKIFLKKISSVLGLFIVCGFSLTLGAILLRVAFSAFTQPTLPPDNANQELGSLATKIGNPGDAAGANTVFGKIAGVGGGGSQIKIEKQSNGSAFIDCGGGWRIIQCGAGYATSNGSLSDAKLGAIYALQGTLGSMGAYAGAVACPWDCYGNNSCFFDYEYYDALITICIQ